MNYKKLKEIILNNEAVYCKNQKEWVELLEAIKETKLILKVPNYLELPFKKECCMKIRWNYFGHKRRINRVEIEECDSKVTCFKELKGGFESD